VLVALAAGVRDPVYSAAFARAVGLAGSNSVERAVDNLVAGELLARRDGPLEITDPFLAARVRPAAATDPDG
jgi:hypothetical protein